jgi:hypothetical protein
MPYHPPKGEIRLVFPRKLSTAIRISPRLLPLFVFLCVCSQAVIFSRVVVGQTEIRGSSEVKIRPRIINGNPLDGNCYPFMASLFPRGMDPLSAHNCAGVLIHPRYILTAAHCVSDFYQQPENLSIMLGRQTLSGTGGYMASSDGIIVNPGFQVSNLHNDVALVRLSSPITDIEPISLVGESEAAAVASPGEVMILGWGSTTLTSFGRSDTMQQATIPIQPESICVERMGDTYSSNQMFCAGRLASAPGAQDGVDACFGDSGGPALLRINGVLKVAGIVSWGFECASATTYGAYTRVSTYSDWIRGLPGVAPYAVTPPSIDGPMTVGKVARCSNGVWRGDGEKTYAYSWSDLDRDITLLNNSSNYRPKLSDIGHIIACQVTASSSSGVTVSSSESPGPVLPRYDRPLTPSAGGFVLKNGSYCEGTQCGLFFEVDRDDIESLTALVRGAGSDCGGSAYRHGCAGQKRMIAGQYIGYKTWEVIVPRRRGWTYGVTLKASLYTSSDSPMSGPFIFRPK